MGRQLWLDVDGVVVKDCTRATYYRTSSDTCFKVIQMNNHELYIDGNLGRFKRHDNLFGYTVAGCIDFLPELLASIGAEADGQPRLTRIDLTENLSVGEGCVSRFTHWAAGQRLGRLKPTVYETGVAWGLGSSHWSAKIYDKNFDLRRTKRSHLAGLIGTGVARREVTLRQKQLEKYDLTNPNEWTENTEEIIMKCIFSQLDKGGCSVEKLAAGLLPLRVENAMQAWRNGKDFVAAYREGQLSRRTLYRLRREVLDHTGIDLFQPSDVRRLAVEVIEIKPVRLEVPAWYEDYTRMAA